MFHLARNHSETRSKISGYAPKAWKQEREPALPPPCTTGPSLRHANAWTPQGRSQSPRPRGQGPYARGRNRCTGRPSVRLPHRQHAPMPGHTCAARNVGNAVPRPLEGMSINRACAVLPCRPSAPDCNAGWRPSAPYRDWAARPGSRRSSCPAGRQPYC